MYLMQDYDDALERILKHGIMKTNRTGVDTLSLFGMQSRYRIDERFPLLTRRRIRHKSMVGELLWFLSGSTLNQDLKDLGCGFWTPWLDKEFEEENGFVDGAFGPLYGFQLRHFGGHYGNGSSETNSNPLYGEGGFDQLAYMVDLLKNNPNDRRILFSLWNPKMMHQMRLPPCHYSFQCYTHDGKLSGMLTQRSCDFPVGVPFNIAFYSALIYMLAQQANLEPYEFVHTTADSHIYVNQIEAVEEYLSRGKPDSPVLKIFATADSIEDYKPSDFVLEDYNPEPEIKFEVAV